MLIICEEIATHMGNINAKDDLFAELDEHNYGYYFFLNSPFFNEKFSIGETSAVERCASVDFGTNSNNNFEMFCMFTLRFFANLGINHIIL